MVPYFKNPWSIASPHYKWGLAIGRNGGISNFEVLVTLTLDRVTLHTIMHHSSTSTYIRNFIKIKETFCGQTDVQADI